MAVMSSLPNEIFVEILSYLDSPDLARTALVSHHLYALAAPLLYKTPCVIANNRSPHASAYFLHTLLAGGHESLVNQVTFLTLLWDEPNIRSILTSNIMAAAVRFGLDQYRLSSQDTHFLILLHLLPRLSVLDVSPPHRHHAVEAFMGAQRSIAHSSLPLALQSLREFRCLSDPRLGGLTRRTLKAIMNLPSIRTVSVAMLEQSYQSSPLPAKPTSPVTDLRIWYNDNRLWSLGRILQYPRALERFSFCLVALDGDFYLPAIADALQPLKNTLQYLRIDFSDLLKTDISDAYNLPTADTIGSLHDWPVLRSVTTSLMLLVGNRVHEEPLCLAERLPAGICELGILTDHYGGRCQMVDMLVDMLQKKKVMLPKLKRLAVKMGLISQNNLKRLRAACEAVEVILVEELSSW